MPFTLHIWADIKAVAGTRGGVYFTATCKRCGVTLPYNSTKSSGPVWVEGWEDQAGSIHGGFPESCEEEALVWVIMNR